MANGSPFVSREVSMGFGQAIASVISLQWTLLGKDYICWCDWSFLAVLEESCRMRGRGGVKTQCSTSCGLSPSLSGYLITVALGSQFTQWVWNCKSQVERWDSLLRGRSPHEPPRQIWVCSSLDCNCKDEITGQRCWLGHAHDEEMKHRVWVITRITFHTQFMSWPCTINYCFEMDTQGFQQEMHNPILSHCLSNFGSSTSHFYVQDVGLFVCLLFSPWGSQTVICNYYPHVWHSCANTVWFFIDYSGQ